MPPGAYRIDGTIELVGSTLRLAARASLLRTNLTASVEPVVRLSNWFGSLVGHGSVETVRHFSIISGSKQENAEYFPLNSACLHSRNMLK